MGYSLRFTKANDLVATPSQSNDVYIVEYPKSGITWLSTIIANLALDASGMNDFEVTFANLRLIIPDIHHGNALGEPIYSNPPIRFIKSHDKLNPAYKFSIYLARHPEKVASSYYRYMVARGHITTDFSSYLRDPKIGIRNWCAHIDSWLTGHPRGGILHLLRYEDLIDDAPQHVGKLCANLGWKVSENMITRALEKSSVAVMKSSEEMFVAHDPRYRAGFVKSDDVEISDNDRRFIRETCATQIELLGYRE